MRNNDEIEKVAHEFVRDCKQEMAQFPLYSVLNADQTGIQKELYGSRAHAFKGAKNVERLVQAKSSLTHSFTFLPMLFMNGTLGPKAYVKLAEPTGRIPPSRPIPAGITNLEYPWKKSGYMDRDANEPEFTTPAEYCMGKATPEDCYISGCVELGCLKCARCQNWVCFDHLVVSQIHLCPLP
ncbi:hypothetical protein CRE_03411 [Caenorhabditis remanei]|uniref:Transposase Tc5 C-terminal domain-containing protein n=1 Tax=Caenorhabditis remanei TaxID=31234 RepID=E3NAK8_CAERE|nr:hypothetical protein CRE_03411 [Caenorhabditis remanei]